MRMGYAAHNFRDAVDASKSKDDYIQEKQKKHPGLTITNYAFENLDSLPKQIGIKYDISLTGQVESTGNLLMIHPLLSEQVKENPFKIDERKFPIDYSYNHSYTYSAQFEIPQGYQVETLPKAQSIALPERHMLFAYSVVANGNTVQVIRRFLINQSLFLPEEYKSLQEFYNQMVAKEAEVIVLKKL